MDIRDSDISYLTEKAKKQSYQRYLPKLKMTNVRSFGNQTISFDFPVTAIIGTNGGGKSTVLGAVALAYKSVKPGDFFPKSNVGDTSMANWKIEYDLLDRAINPTAPFSRNARFVSARWKRESPPDRNVVSIPIQRTVPANEQAKFRRFIGTVPLDDIVIDPIGDEILNFVGRILGKDPVGYKRVSMKNDQTKSILLGASKGNDYSQFHFGAGEASIIEMVDSIEKAPESSLILIEELENGLHPLATQKMVEYLLSVAKRKHQQIVFTTHSEYALQKLPPEAIWACIDGVAYQGKLRIDSLRALTGSIEKDRVVFVEDEFASDLCIEIIRQYEPSLIERVEIHKAGGFPYVVDVLKHHNQNPTITSAAVAIIDGDNPPLPVPDHNVISLPPGSPEVLVYHYIHDNVEEISALIQQRCQCPNVSQDTIIAAVRAVKIDTTDHHLYFSKLGERFGYISETVIRRGLCSIFVERSSATLGNLVQEIRERLS